MSLQALAPLRWNTSSSATSGATLSSDLISLVDHYHSCSGCQGRWFKIQCAAEALHAFVAPRFVTTLLAVCAVVTVTAAAFV